MLRIDDKWVKDVTANAPWRNPPVIDVDDSDDEQSGSQVIAADDSGQCHLSGSEDSDHWGTWTKGASSKNRIICFNIMS